MRDGMVLRSVGLMVAVVVGLGASATATAGDGGSKAGAKGPAVRLVKGDSDILPVGDSPTWGPKDAPVTVVMFSEFQCPFCSRVVPTLAQLRQEYKGQVQLVFKHNPLSFHKDAPLASEAAWAAHEQGRFWEMHDLLFQNQRALQREDLEGYARQLGLDMKKFNQVLDSGKYKARIAEDQALAEKVGARGTPNFFINGIKVVGAKPIDGFREVIDEELKVSKKGAYSERVKVNFKNEPPAPRNNRPPADDTTVYKVPVGKSPVIGGKNAVVTIVTFSEFQCPFCGRVQGTLRELLEENKGEVRLVFKHLPLPFHKDAPLAAEATMAAFAQGRFWEMHDLLFQNQKAIKREDLEGYAKQLGLNMKKFNQDLDGGKYKALVEADMALARKVGARGTPHFFVNGVRLSGAQPVDRFRTAIEEAIVRARPLTDKGLKGDKLYNALMKDAAEEFKLAAEVDPVEETVYQIDVAHSPVRGRKGAPVTVVIFSDFQCPFCSRAVPTISQVEQTYKGKVQVVFKHLPLPFHQDARLAAIATMAAHEQGKFWEMYEVLFQNQKALQRQDLEGYAKQLGLNMRKFNQALDDPKLAALVEADMAQARKVGASGTPTFFINGRKLVGAQPFDKFKEMIDKALDE